MSFPSEPVPVPEVVAGIAAGRPVVAGWVNELGGVTFEVDDGREYVKVSPAEWAHLRALPSQAGGPPACGGGDLGVADRWADIAVAMLSLSWNLPGSWEGELLDAYGVDADPARIEAYQR